MMMDVNQRRIKRGEIRSTLKVTTLEGPQGCVYGEAAQSDDYRQNLLPPRSGFNRVICGAGRSRGHSLGWLRFRSEECATLHSTNAAWAL
jgi:hypothetical protein